MYLNTYIITCISLKISVANEGGRYFFFLADSLTLNLGTRSFFANIVLDDSSMCTEEIVILILFSITPMKSLTLCEVMDVLELKTFRMGASSQANCLEWNRVSL